jgi:hypothetical protein
MSGLAARGARFYEFHGEVTPDFRNRTPRPPPFSSMNSTPAASCVRYIGAGRVCASKTHITFVAMPVIVSSRNS